MIETNHGHIQLPACVEGCPSGEVRVADLDQFGLQVLQDIAPRGETQRESITLAERQGGRRNGIDAILFTENRPGDQ
ncbi:hypothetical protein D3C81_2139020 [compost metagenome]